MESLIVRTCAYYGLPIDVGGVPTRSGWIHEATVPGEGALNDPHGDVFATKDSTGRLSTYSFDVLLDDFEAEFDCKVSLSQTSPKHVIELEVFEPEWDDSEETVQVISELNDRVVEWVTGVGALAQSDS